MVIIIPRRPLGSLLSFWSLGCLFIFQRAQSFHQQCRHHHHRHRYESNSPSNFPSVRTTTPKWLQLLPSAIHASASDSASSSGTALVSLRIFDRSPGICCRQSRRCHDVDYALWSKPGDDEEEEDSISLGKSSISSSSQKKEQPDPLTHSYRRASYLFGFWSVLLLFLPFDSRRVKLATKMGSAAGFGISSGLCHILATATSAASIEAPAVTTGTATPAETGATSEHDNDNDRDQEAILLLASDTRKRLNLGLALFFSIGLFAVPGEAAFSKTFATALLLSCLLTISRVYGLLLSVSGWKRGILLSNGNNNNRSLEIRDFYNELVKGMKSTLTGLRVRYRKKALTYRNLLLLILMGVFSSFMEGIFDLRVRYL